MAPDTPRICFTVLIDQFNEHGYIPSLVTEGEAGHSPLVGSGELAEPWYWGTDYEKAKWVCAQANERLGLTPDDVFEIITSSMAAGNAVEARMREVGLRPHGDRIDAVQTRLIREGVIT